MVKSNGDGRGNGSQGMGGICAPKQIDSITTFIILVGGSESAPGGPIEIKALNTHHINIDRKSFAINYTARP